MKKEVKIPLITAEPSKTELYTRKILGILLILLILAPLAFPNPATLNIYGLFLLILPIAITISIYLLKSKRYHLVLNAFLVLLGALMYNYFIPFIGFPPMMLKVVLMTSYWSEAFPWLIFFLTVSKILILGSAIFLFVGDILVRSKAFVRSPKRDAITIVILLAVFAVLISAPFLRSVVASGSPEGTAMSISSGGFAFNIGLKDTSVNFDSKNNLWTYQITARNQLNEDAEIAEIISLHQPSGGFINIFSEKRQLAPPFGEGIEVSGGEKTNEKIVVKPGSAVTLKIFLKDPALVISLVEKGGRYDIGFWGFADEHPQMRTETKTEVKLEIVEALDPNVKVFLAGAIPPTPETFKTHFAAGEPIYPQEQGLAKGTKYGFRVVNATGEVVIPLDLGHLEEVRDGTGIEGHGMFNSGKPLPSGPYRMELIKVEGGKGFIVAYENFSVS